MGPDALIEIAWKSLALCAGVLVLLRCAHSLSANKRALIGHGGVCAALLLFPLVIWGPVWAVELQTQDAPVAYSVVSTASGDVSTPLVDSRPPEVPAQPVVRLDLPDLSTLVTALYASVVLILLTATGLSLWRVRALGRRSVPTTDPHWLGVLAEQKAMAGIARPVALRISTEIGAPLSIGLWRPVIVLDRESFQTPACARAVLGHELAHIASHDWCKLILCRLAVAILWFNPMIWILSRACTQLREEAVDDIVLRREVRFDYASLLIAVASRQTRGPVMLSNSLASTENSLKRRIARILAKRMDRAPAGIAVKAACGAFVALTVPLAALTPAAAALPSPSAANAPRERSTPHSASKPSPPAQLGRSAAASVAQTPLNAVATTGVAPENGDVSVLPPLNGIHLIGWAEIRVRHGPEPQLRVLGGSTKHAVFNVDEAGQMSVMACTAACPPQNLVLEVTTPNLPSLGVIGGGVIEVQRGFPAQADIKASITGGGVVDVGSVRTRAGRVDIMDGGSVIADPQADLETNITEKGSVIRSDRAG